MYFLELSYHAKNHQITFQTDKPLSDDLIRERRFGLLSHMYFNYAYIEGGLEFSFEPNRYTKKEYLNDLMQAENTNDRLLIYDAIFAQGQRTVVPGIIFGLKYAYNIYIQESQEDIKGVYIGINIITTGHDDYNEHFAYLAAKGLWKILDFEPQEKIIFDIKNAKYYFPKSENDVPKGDHIFPQTDASVPKLTFKIQ